MKSPYFRPSQDLGRCGSGYVLMIDGVHRLASLAKKNNLSFGPSIREVLVAVVAHSCFRMLHAFDRIVKRLCA